MLIVKAVTMGILLSLGFFDMSKAIDIWGVFKPESLFNAIFAFLGIFLGGTMLLTFNWRGSNAMPPFIVFLCVSAAVVLLWFHIPIFWPS